MLNGALEPTALISGWPLLALASGLMMLADYWLTLWAAQPALKIGALYELNPWLRPAVAAQRWGYPPFILAALGIVVMLGGIGSLAQSAEDAFIFYALCSGIILTRLHLVILHLVNRLRPVWQTARQTPAPRPLTVPAAMLKLAVQQTALAAVWTLAVRSNPWPWLQPWLVGAAAGFLLMAAMTLIWREIEFRRRRRATAALQARPRQP